MTLPDRKEAEVRRLLETPAQPLPPDLAHRALTLGARLTRRRRALHLAVCLTLLLALLACGLWLVTTDPWAGSPPSTTPTTGW